MKEYVILNSKDIKTRINRHFNFTGKYEVVLEIDAEAQKGTVYCISEDGYFFDATKECNQFLKVNFLTNNKYVDYKFLDNDGDMDFKVVHYQGQPLCYFSMKPCVNDFNKFIGRKHELCKVMNYEYLIVKTDELEEKFGCLEIEKIQVRNNLDVITEQRKKYISIKNITAIINEINRASENNITEKVSTRTRDRNYTFHL